jgi:diguanylate cyclase (GGDEF)-like protein
MALESLIALQLRNGNTPQPSVALRPVVDRLLGLLGTVIESVEHEEERQALQVQLEQCRAAVAAAPPADLARVSDTCFALCDKAIALLQAQQSERQGELQRLVALVRDTVTVLTGDGDAFSSDIAQAANRFNLLLRVTDVEQLKLRLSSEVGKLQALAAERQQQWQETIAMFEARVATLETQLVAIREESAQDPLTGAANRRGFETAFKEYVETPPREFVLALLDLDDFKRINDTAGHMAGDEVLISVAKTLRAAVRGHDIVARIGGDEFGMLIAGLTLRQAETRLRHTLKQLAEIPAGPVAGHLTVSCGLVECCAGDTARTLMMRADEALYEAKRQGKNRLAVKSPPLIRDLKAGMTKSA